MLGKTLYVIRRITSRVGLTVEAVISAMRISPLYVILRYNSAARTIKFRTRNASITSTTWLGESIFTAIQ